jgi:hypothetical protein
MKPKSHIQNKNFKEQPTILGRIRFILREPAYSPLDKIEYLSYLLFGTVGLVLFVFLLIKSLVLGRSLNLIFVLMLLFMAIILTWMQSRKIQQRFVFPYRSWAAGVEYARTASAQFNQMMHESIRRGEKTGNTAFIWTSRLFFGLYFVFYFAGIFFSIIYPLQTEVSFFVVIGGGVVLLIGLVILRKDISSYIQAVRQKPLLYISISILVVLIGVFLGLLFIYRILITQ